MASIKTLSVIALSAALANAHGHVSQIVADGVQYVGAIPHSVDPASPGWPANNQDNGFVEPAAFSSPDIVCHKGATASAAYAKVAAGGTVTVTWNTWPESHLGPVIDYLARCEPDCASANKASLSFAKIQESGLNGGTWAVDTLMANGNKWDIKIPSNVAPGKYVLRHEIIALHSGGQANGAQAYPQCINIEVTGGGSVTPQGEPATAFYTPTDPGILFDLYKPDLVYPIPGPAVWSV